MPLKQENLERQLTNANEALAVCTADLESLGLTRKERHKNTNWRRLSARRRDIMSRHKAAQAVVQLTEQRNASRAEKANADSNTEA